MARGRRSNDKWSIRLFDTSAQTGIVELGDRKFDDERQMHRLIEDNMGTLFPGLTFLKSEFSEMAKGERRLDTVAFDTGRNTFVVLEYKNRPNAEAVDQARTYLTDMGDDRADLVLLYNKIEGDTRDKSAFNWKEMYAIIMAPEFGKFQRRGADKDSTVELYKVRMYGEHMMLMERVGGGHDRTSTTAFAPGSSAKTARTLNTVRHKPTPDANRRVATPRPISLDGDAKLPDIEYTKGMRHPEELAYPDGSRRHLKSWTGILAGVAEWLVSKGYLDESHCPVPIGQNNSILNTQPIHQNGRQFRYFKEAGHLYVYLNVDPAKVILHSIKMIGIAGLSPSDFMVSFGDSVRPVRTRTSPARVTIARGSSVPGCEETNRCYVPHTVTVDVGGKVIWTNDDLATHTVTSGVLTKGGPDGVFDSGLFAPEAEFSHVFEEAGKYHYFDLVHPWMQGVVLVKE